ncbi:MAG: histidine--tRNA ligase [Gemmatimonadetes bacterium]|nr:histidine--tRNA ligase [Gemmatimonadota bacterium]
MPQFARLPGFRDFPPDELGLRSHVLDAWRRVSRRYGFEEYDGPPLEALELYAEKSGEEIVEQLYAFEDKGGRWVALRPEMTPSLARILGARARALPKPIRWFSVPQLFRYERQQRGRLREHFQWNVDIVGDAGVGADAEVVAVAIDGLRGFGLTAADFQARLSHRGLLAALLAECGVSDDRVMAVFGVIDKLGREAQARIGERLASEVGLGVGVADRVLSLFEGADPASIDSHFGGNEAVARELGEVRRCLEDLGAMGLGDYVQFDLSIVRGLAYYTGIVFELFDCQGELRAICGGGRYDRLLELVGGEPLPAVGFGMGDVVLGELIKARGLEPRYERSVDYYMVVIDGVQRPLALRLAHRLRERGHTVTYAFTEQPVRKQFSSANADGARAVIILGPDEVSAGMARLRDMRTGEERTVALEELQS